MKYEIKQSGQNGRSLGEFTIDTIRANVQTGAIEEGYLARKQGATEWITVASLLHAPIPQATQTAAGKPSLSDGNDDSRRLMSRYTDAYRIARTVTAFGATVKVIAIIVGAPIGLIGLVAGLASGDHKSVLVAAAGVILGVIFAVPIFILGILVSAQGQILKATLDTAVNSSPLLSKDEMRQIMSLD